MKAVLGRLVIYTLKLDEMVEFYSRYFGYQVYTKSGDRIVELRPVEEGAIIMLHPAGKAQKQGQVLVKIVFDVEDVEVFHLECRRKGLDFGVIHQADGYQFANTKDPSANSVSISSRAFSLP